MVSCRGLKKFVPLLYILDFVRERTIEIFVKMSFFRSPLQKIYFWENFSLSHRIICHIVDIDVVVVFANDDMYRDVPENQFALAESFTFSVASRGRRSWLCPAVSCSPSYTYLGVLSARTFSAPPLAQRRVPFPAPSHLVHEGAYVLLLPFS